MTAATRERAIQVVVGANEPTQHSGLIQALQVDGDIVVVGEPAGAAQAVSVVAEIRPDAVILDLDPSDHGSQHAIEQIMADTPTPIPVSYTHLRAHETRHDLVCRLLLEKKKHTKYR